MNQVDMTAAKPLHPTAVEYESRLDRVRRRMEQDDIELLVVTDPSNMYYLSGYNAWSFYTPQCLVVPLSGDMVLFSREMDAAGACTSSWFDASQVEGYPDELVHQPDTHPFDWIARRIAERGLAKPGMRVATEGDSHYFSVRGFRSLQAGLSGVTFLDSNELVNWVRLVKSDLEIEYMRLAGDVATRAMRAGIDAVGDGALQADVAATIAEVQFGPSDGIGGDYPSMVPMIVRGAGDSAPHPTWREDSFDRGVPYIIELAGVFRRYNVPYARTAVVGEAPTALVDVASMVHDSVQDVLAELRPGMRADQVEATWQESITRKGLRKDSRLGYSVGIGFPPDWGERTISIRRGDETVLEPNMCLHLVTWLSNEGFSYMESEPVVITTDGFEKLAGPIDGLTRKSS